ncbi:MAG: hypothetical protein ACP5RW_07790 [bacterium]
MEREYLKLSDSDLLFVVETVAPSLKDRLEIIRNDEDIIRGMLEDERLFNRIIGDEDIMIKVSPKLFFTILMIRARKDLRGELYTMERDRYHKIPVFDVEKVRELIEDEDIFEYLINMLVSFTRTESQTIYYVAKGKKGLRKLRFSDIDIADMIRLADMVNEEVRFPIYKRIGDICLWTIGIFPEYVLPRDVGSTNPRARVGFRYRMSIKEYEDIGRAFYKMASSSYDAKIIGLEKPLSILSENFTIAEKPLNFISERYLVFTKDKWFISLN